MLESRAILEAAEREWRLSIVDKPRSTKRYSEQLTALERMALYVEHRDHHHPHCNCLWR